jgi:hypothetical protein
VKESYVLEAQQTGLGLYQLRHGRISSIRIMTLTGTGPSILNVKFLILFKKFYKVHSVEVLSQDPH